MPQIEQGDNGNFIIDGDRRQRGNYDYIFLGNNVLEVFPVHDTKERSYKGVFPDEWTKVGGNPYTDEADFISYINAFFFYVASGTGGGGGIEEAPIDEELYGRIDGDWAQIAGGTEIDPIFEASEASNFVAGDKANLDNQSGTNTGDETDASVKTKYENNLNTNAFTDAEKTNLSNQSGTNTGDETIGSIQTKRPLKTVEGQSLEGSGNILLTKADVELDQVDNTSDLDKPISDLTQLALNGKKDDFTENTAFNKDFGNVVGTVCEGNDSRLSDARTPTAHTHTSLEITDFQTAVSGNADVSANTTKLAGIEDFAKDDQLASEVPFSTNGDIAATDVQSAI
jgi:hypothetical protein